MLLVFCSCLKHLAGSPKGIRNLQWPSDSYCRSTTETPRAKGHLLHLGPNMLDVELASQDETYGVWGWLTSPLENLPFHKAKTVVQSASAKQLTGPITSGELLLLKKHRQKMFAGQLVTPPPRISEVTSQRVASKMQISAHKFFYLCTLVYPISLGDCHNTSFCQICN